MADLALLRKEKLATDTRILVVNIKGVASDPILVHSLVLAAASPGLASVLASSGQSFSMYSFFLKCFTILTSMTMKDLLAIN